MKEKEIKLKVAEAIQDDVNKGIVRIDSSFMKDIEIRPGDIVEIEGERKTVAIADRAYPGDIGLNLIRMDGIIRRNAKTGIGEVIKVRKTEVKEAKKVIIAPDRKGVIVRASPNIFKQGLLGRAVVKGDIVALGGTRKRRTTLSDSPFFEDIFNILDESMMGFGFGDLKFIVAETLPKQAVIISEQTGIIFNPEAIEVKEEEVLEVTYEDIGGLNEEIQKVREMVELPLKHPELFERLGIEPPKGVLLHGPPGTGKTLLAKAVANETNSHFILINGPEIMSKYYGQSEENLRKKFEEAEKNAPSIIFIDEIDAIATKREETYGEVERRVVAQLLANMDGLQSRGKVVVIAATNIPNSLDPALRRPGRFDREIEIGVPDKKGRETILKIHTRNMPLDNWDDGITAKILLAKLNSFEDVFNKEIEENISKINTLQSQKEETQKELESLSDELKKLEEERKRYRDESLINKILNKIRLKKNQIIELKTKIEKLEEEINKLDNNIKKKKEDIRVINKRKEEIKKDKKLLDAIVKEITSIKHLIGVRGYKDVRNAFSEERLNKISEDIRKIIDDFVKREIISDELFVEIKKESISYMLKELANITHGFVGADVSALAKEAAMTLLRKVLPEIKLKEDEPIPKELLEKLRITKDDFRDSLKIVRPSALREVLIEKPNVRWTDIGGLEDVKQELIEAVEWPLKHPEAFKRMGVKPPKGILIYGAPGTGKTMLAKAVAKESEANFISVKGPELLSKFVGESEKAVRAIFKKARQTAPTIIFFDEIDSLAPRRGVSSDSHVSERVVNQLLTEIDGLEEMHDVVIIAATNRPDIVDPGLLRPGRFDRIILTPIPDKATRLEIFKVHTKGMPLKDVNIEALAEKTEGYVGSDIEAICREAAIFALRKDIKAKEITVTHFNAALKKVKPSVTKDIEKSYEDLQDQFKAARAKQMQEEKPSYMG